MDSATRFSGVSRAFTLVEVLLSLTLAMILIAAVLASNVLLLKSQALTAAYAGMNSQSRNGLELMADDVRQMRSISILKNGFSGLVPGASSGTTNTISYQFDSVLGQVTRSSNNKTTPLWTQVKSCQFSFFGAGTMNTGLTPARMNRGTALVPGTSTKVKQVQITLTAQTTVLRTLASQQTISAQFTARP